MQGGYIVIILRLHVVPRTDQDLEGGQIASHSSIMQGRGADSLPRTSKRKLPSLPLGLALPLWEC